MASEALTSAGGEIRENLVTTAVKFLTNPSVQRCTIESKERFLRSKGLTDLEIQKAIGKCTEMLDVPSMTSELMFFHQSRRSWFRDNVLPLLVYGGFMYGAYWFYKNYVRHLLFVEQPKRKTTAECIDELRKSVDVLNANFTSLRSEMTANAHQSALRSQLDNVKSEIASVKAIMLNRNQFPVLKTRTGPPSIPDWQRQSEEATSTEVPSEDKKKTHRSRSQRSESGGSNSSEGEQATKNSDSSLEIMNFMKSDKPRRPMSAYMMWLHSTKEQYKADNPGLKTTDVARNMSAIWKTMDKSEWEEKAAKAKEQYEKDMKLYEAANSGTDENVHQPKENNTNLDTIRNFMKSDKPRRPMTPYMMWLNNGREQFKAENPGLKVTELAKKMGAVWKAMDKSEWEEKHAKAMEQYEKDMALYEAANGGSTE
ncbi:hypothetical protein PYW08_004261 [Mythimna loreyi]|uniref:Uncharacterized protein n=1 Tax=Mythimna loreyi TaxID=667449 RepID=A0ACC2QNR3_9NEOP|nr:hypothetical protein PYW08_004261 [Mythimna loreyi]